jgi:hypothetical protein
VETRFAGPVDSDVAGHYRSTGHRESLQLDTALTGTGVTRAGETGQPVRGGLFNSLQTASTALEGLSQALGVDQSNIANASPPGFASHRRSRAGSFIAAAPRRHSSPIDQLFRYRRINRQSPLLENLKQADQGPLAPGIQPRTRHLRQRSFSLPHTTEGTIKDTIKDRTDGRVAQVDRALAF